MAEIIALADTLSLLIFALAALLTAIGFLRLVTPVGKLLLSRAERRADKSLDVPRARRLIDHLRRLLGPRGPDR